MLPPATDPDPGHGEVLFIGTATTLLRCGGFAWSPRCRFRVYVSGDTLLHDDLREIPRRYPEIDLALVHLGGTKVLGVLVTMDGRQGVRFLQLIRPRTAIPIHYDDYTVFKSPLEDFRRQAARAPLETTCTYLRHGETHRFEVPATR